VTADATTPEAGLQGRRVDQPAGRGLGGSGLINGMIYIRGQREDYDHWAALGNPGWRYDDVLPYFRKSEDQERGANEYHGVGGPLKVSDLRLRRPIAEHHVQEFKALHVPAEHDQTYGQRRGQNQPNRPPQRRPQGGRGNHCDRRKTRAVAVEQRLDDMTGHRLDDEKECRRPQQHRPTGVHGGSKRQREHSRDEGADVGDKA